MAKDPKIYESVLKKGDLKIVAWSDTYATGIEMIDNQHKELVKLTNNLYRACLNGNESADTAFKEAITSMVEYVRIHFATEEKLLELINYPDCLIHKKQHEVMRLNILEAVEDYGKGVKFVPNNFARTLKEWIFSHIAVHDKAFAIYIHDQKKKGLL